jgi:hypothetical protein
MMVRVKCRCIFETEIELDTKNYPDISGDEDDAGDQMIAHELEFFNNNPDDFFEVASVGDDQIFKFEVVRA